MDRWKMRALFLALLVFSLPSPSHAQYFGKNKVHYKDFDWNVIRTEHFEVYYYETEKTVALDAARMAERSYQKLSKVLGYRMQRLIPLILYASHSDFQQTNISRGLIGEGTGGVTEFIKRRVFLPFTGSYSELEHVLTHEMVHAFQVEILFGSSGSVLANTLGFSPPLWFMEGMAEYLSLGKVDVHTSMWLRDAALQGYLVSVPILGRVGDIRVYRFGQSIFDFLGGKYGDEKIGEILRAAPRVGGIDPAFKSVLGLSLEKFSDEWLEEVRRTYLPQIADYSKPSRFARRITRSGEDLSSLNLVPAVSPSGERVCFISDRSMYSDIYLAETGSGKIDAKLVEGERTGDFESLRFFNTSISWSPDERFIAFPAKIGAEDAIYIYSIEKRKIVRRLTFGFDAVVSPSWAPDGKRLVFVALEGGRSNLFTCSADGSDLERLTDDRFTCRDPQWSPDGRTIAFTTDRGPDTDFKTLRFGNYKIAILDLASRTIEVLGGMEGKNIAPQWSPDGKDIIFVSDRTGVSNLYDIQLEDGRVFRLTNILTGVTGIIPEAPPFSWSRDGKVLVFSAFSRGGWDLYVLDDPLRLKNVPVGGEVEEEEKRPESPLSSSPPVVAGKTMPEQPPGGPRAHDFDEPVGGHAGATPLAVAAAVPVANVERPVPSAKNPGSRLIDLRGLFPDGERPVDDSSAAKSAGADGYALPDSSDFEFERYKLKFSQDFLFGGAGFASNIGFAGQSAISFSDVLGNHNISFSAGIYGSLADADIFLSYANLKKRLNYAATIFQYRNDFYIYSASSSPDYQSQVYRGVELRGIYPFSTFKRFEAGIRGQSISSRVFQQSFYGVEQVDAGTTEYFALPFVALVTDNVLYGPTGPINGSRSRYSLEFAAGDVSYTTGIADVRNYWNIRHRYSFASRMIVGASHGRDNQFFRIGGPFTFRGADWGELRGIRLAVTNLEFRYPFIDELRFGWPLPLVLRGIGGVLFLDGAAAWNGGVNDVFPLKDLEPDINGNFSNAYGFAYGFGARVNLGFFILRWDYGQQTDFQRNIGSPRRFLTIASDF